MKWTGSGEAVLRDRRSRAGTLTPSRQVWQQAGRCGRVKVHFEIPATHPERPACFEALKRWRRNTAGESGGPGGFVKTSRADGRKRRRRTTPQAGDSLWRSRPVPRGTSSGDGKHLGCGGSWFPSRGAARGGPGRRGGASRSVGRARSRRRHVVARWFLLLRQGSPRARDTRCSSRSGWGEALVVSDHDARTPPGAKCPGASDP